MDRRANATDSRDDLHRAVEAHEAAADALTEHDPSEATVRCNLGMALQHRYERAGSRTDLAEAISQHRRALKLTLTEKDIQYPVRTEGLANALMSLFESREDPEALAEAIELRRATLELLPGDPMWKGCQANLAGSLFRRYKRTGDTDSLADAERLMREVVEEIDARDRIVRSHPICRFSAIMLGGLGFLGDVASKGCRRRGSVERLDHVCGPRAARGGDGLTSGPDPAYCQRIG
ncbi:MAG TPA: hypothetical protein VGZ32_07470 [Actinocrinis sp.]|uniref:hypothetical protein n=1 Tax=Actinocrinis sp. TaxID=1920516 RepID=UPI002DDD17A4|nr:hypothetical protein [Actinocrinis sp.]HEV3170160.1 hypothetical protein [Actinocrinis sp.]